MRKQVQKVIYDHTYVITVHPAIEGLELSDELLRIAGASLASATSDSEFQVAGAVIQSVGKAGLAKLAPSLLRYTSRDGTMLTAAAINDLFAGQLGQLMLVCAWAMEVNFADFFDEVKRLVAEAMPPKAELS